MTTKSLSKFFTVALLTALLAACGPSPSSAPPAAEATSAPEPTEAATETDVETPAETPASEASTSDSDLPTGQHIYVIVPEESSASYLAEEEFLALRWASTASPRAYLTPSARPASLRDNSS